MGPGNEAKVHLIRHLLYNVLTSRVTGASYTLYTVSKLAIIVCSLPGHECHHRAAPFLVLPH